MVAFAYKLQPDSNLDAIVFSDGLVHHCEVVIDQDIVKHSKRRFYGVLSAVPGGELILAVRDYRFQNMVNIPSSVTFSSSIFPMVLNFSLPLASVSLWPMKYTTLSAGRADAVFTSV